MRTSVGQVTRRGVLRCRQQVLGTEYVALGEGRKEALLTDAVLSFIRPELSGSCVRVVEYNQGGIALADTLLSSASSKRIDVRFHFVR